MRQMSQRDREKKIKTKKMIRFYIWRLLSLIIITLFSFLIGFYIVSEKAKKIKDEEDEKANKLKDEIQRTKNAKLANMLITSGFNFDGYTIVKYSGYISGDDAVEIDRGTSGAFFKANQAVNVKDMLMDSLAVIRRNALQELKEKAYDLGCNAVIGVDFDYINLDPETANVHGGTTYLPYIFGVTANGNAVIIKKNDE